MPAASALQITPAQLDALLVHEIAHIRRFDYPINLAQMLVETLFFYHPAVWWTSNQIRTARELCCDEEAVAWSGDAHSYAEALASAARLQLESSRTALFATRWMLLQRIQRLLGHQVPAPTPSTWSIVTAVALVAASGALNWNWVRPQAQTRQGELPAAQFEVASIKRNVEPNVQLGIRPINNGSRFSAVVTAKMLIQVAYGYEVALLDSQIVDAPAWVNEDQFEIVATPDGPIAERPDAQPLRLFAMMQNLLADRFRLRLRRQTRQLPIYELVMERGDGRPGPRLRPPDGLCEPFRLTSGPIADFSRLCGIRNAGPGGLTGRSVTLEDLARRLAFNPDVQRIVRDRTGLSSTFDLDLEFTPFNVDPEPSAAPTIFTALREQLGVQLDPATGPVEVLVIEHVEPPTPG